MTNAFKDLEKELRDKGCTCKLITNPPTAIREGDPNCPVHPWQNAVQKAQAM